MNLSLCMETFFTDRPFVERMHAAFRLGYSAIEFWDWQTKDLTAIGEKAAQLRLTIAAMSGNRRYSLIDPESRAGLVDEMGRAFAIARQLGCRHLMMLSDVLASDGSAVLSRPVSQREKFDSVVEGLRALVRPAAEAGVVLLLEPLNPKLDHHGYFLDHSRTGFEILRRVDSPQVRLLYDIYHMSMMDEDVMAEIEGNLDWIGYLHVADAPGRHQPGTGKIDYRAIADRLKGVRFQGFVGMEFFPEGPDEGAALAAKEIFM
ncbi:MAG: TIM barrel protein [Thermodesulfobacteriota bacterium]